MGYVNFPIESNPYTLLQQAYEYIKTRSPAWVEHDGNLDTWILQASAQQASDLRILATDVPDTIFRYFGDTVLGLPPNPATQALSTSTWTAIDQLGHLIPAGTLVGIRDVGGVLRGFETTTDYTILPGLTSTDVGEVSIRATEAGAASSNIGVDGTEIELIDALDFVQTVTLNGTTAYGADAESINDYMLRLSEYMRGLSTRPILPEDYARLARNQPGVFRAVAIDGYNPNDDTYFNERTITVVGIDQFGLDLPQEVQDDLDTMLQSMREVNFVVNVIDASRTPINVYFEAVAIPNYSTTALESNIIAAVTSYLSPQNWGFDRSFTQAADRTWVETHFLYYSEVMSVISNVDGVDHVETLTINRSTDAPGTNDVTLDVPAALTEPNVIDGIILR